MDIENLIEQLNDWNEKYISNLCGYRTIKCEEYCIKDDCLIVKAATALSTLQAENEQLRAEVNRLEYERDYPCIYFKAGGLCRYGGDESEANICVMGPCEVETTAEDVDRLRAELERVEAERDAAITDLKKWSICATCKNYCPRNKSTHCRVKRAYLPGGNWAGCSNWQWRGPQKEG